jgi:hypothetical protein
MWSGVARAVVVAIAALVGAGGTAGGANAQGIIDRLTGAVLGTASFILGTGSFWQGAWGLRGQTPVVVVSGWNVAYHGANGQPFAVSRVNISGSQITFQAGRAQVALIRRGDNQAEFVSTIGEHSSAPIVLCRSNAGRCR